VLLLRICGDLDLASRDRIERTVLAAVVSTSAVTLDLARVTLCDSQGVAMLVAAHEKATAEGTTLTIRNAQPNVQRVFEISGLAIPIDTTG
jgi:anti-sigma B factor antagonist